MGTYYGYAEREVENQIDWSKVGKDVSDMLATEVQLREEKKAEIEKATQEYGKQLSEFPVGSDAKTAAKMAGMTDEAQKIRLMQDRLLRSGQISIKQYNMMRHNTTSGTNQMFDFVDEYTARFDEFKERTEKGVNSQFEIKDAEELGVFSTFRDTKPTFNPATGELLLSKIDGEDSEGYSFSTLRTMLYNEVDKFDVMKVSDDIAKNYAKTYKIVDPDGKLLTIDDIRNQTNYEKTIDKFAAAALEGNPYASGSILVDFLSAEGYKVSDEGGDKDVKTVWNEDLQRKVPELTDAQKEVAKEALIDSIEASFQRVETPKPEKSSGGGKPPASQKTDITRTNQMKKLYQAKNQREVKDALLALNQGRFTSFDFKYNAKVDNEPAYYEVLGINVDDSTEIVVGEIRAGVGEFNNLLTGSGTDLAQVKDIETARKRGAFTGDENVGSIWKFDEDSQIPSIPVDVGIAREQKRTADNKASLEAALGQRDSFAGVTAQADFVKKFNEMPAIKASSFRLTATGSKYDYNYVSIVDSNNQLVTGIDIGFENAGETRNDGKFYIGKDPKGAYDAIAKYILDNQDPADMGEIKVP